MLVKLGVQVIEGDFIFYFLLQAPFFGAPPPVSPSIHFRPALAASLFPSSFRSVSDSLSLSYTHARAPPLSPSLSTIQPVLQWIRRRALARLLLLPQIVSSVGIRAALKRGGDVASISSSALQPRSPPLSSPSSPTAAVSFFPIFSSLFYLLQPRRHSFGTDRRSLRLNGAVF